MFANPYIEWKYASRNFFHDCVIGGEDVNGESLYVGRAVHNGCFVPGKIVPSFGCIIIPADDKEVRYTNYEYLAKPKKGKFVWKSAHTGSVPPNAVSAGKGSPYYVGRAIHTSSYSSMVIGKIDLVKGNIHLPYRYREEPKTHYEALVYEP